MRIVAGGNLDENDAWVKGASIIDLSSLGGKKEVVPDYLKPAGTSLYIKDTSKINF